MNPLHRRLVKAEGGRERRGGGRELSASTIRLEVNERVSAIACGRIGAMHMLARKTGLIDALPPARGHAGEHLVRRS